MDSRSKERIEELPTVETPEDVAVLYSWANLHGAKYRDFSASRREYRAQLRHRAAEQAREQELRAQANAEHAATFAEQAARQAEEAAMSNKARETEYSHQQALREAEEAARVAAAERIEAVRRGESVALAEAAARREERELAEANASARRKTAQYAEAEARRKQAETRESYQEVSAEVPGEISDPYTPLPQQLPRQAAIAPQTPVPQASVDHEPARYRTQPESHESALTHVAPQLSASANVVDYAPESVAIAPLPTPARRRQGYRPDDASGVRQIYRGPEFEAQRGNPVAQPALQLIPVQDSRVPAEPHAAGQKPWATPQTSMQGGQDRASAWSDGITAPTFSSTPTGAPRQAAAALPAQYASAGTIDPRTARVKSTSPFTQTAASEAVQDATPRRRRQDAPGYKEEHPSDSGPGRRRDDMPVYGAKPQTADRRPAMEEPTSRIPIASELSGPAWLYASSPQPQPKSAPVPAPPQSSVADTLQHSRERVAARWYALKGVFEQPGQERAEPAPVRQKETRTPILAVFSMAGGVGKTSLVATLGRSLSSLGEKVLLTDTTSHGLLPFYFGASELRQGTVRTFSPPSGSTDAPIYLVSYDVDQKSSDEAAQDALVDEITASSRGTHRVLLDLTVNSGWIVRRMARLSPTVLVPVAPDMNSVISLAAVEKFFHGVVDPEGGPLKIFYLLNQFDASLPLHLDIREVLRRQLGDRLLPFVIRRAPSVGEALAEGMTIVDYSPEAPVAEDYLNAATWLRTVAAPATAGFRNVRWSER